MVPMYRKSVVLPTGFGGINNLFHNNLSSIPMQFLHGNFFGPSAEIFIPLYRLSCISSKTNVFLPLAIFLKNLTDMD
jgi:hypothetical protein